MGTGKRERTRVDAQQAKAGSQARLTKPLKGENFYHDSKKVKQLNMQKSGRAVRNEHGKIVKPAAFQSKLASGTVGRIQPDRRWFGMCLYVNVIS
jgi:nuclear GTP-binding protein